MNCCVRGGRNTNGGLAVYVVRVASNTISFSQVDAGNIRLLGRGKTSNRRRLARTGIERIRSCCRLILAGMTSAGPVGNVLGSSDRLPGRNCCHEVIGRRSVTSNNGCLIILRRHSSSDQCIMVPRLRTTNNVGNLSLFSTVDFRSSCVIAPEFAVHR